MNHNKSFITVRNNLLFILVISLLGACSTSNNVVSSGIIQKRKFNKGWHFNKKSKIKSQSVTDCSKTKSFEATITPENTVSGRKDKEKPNNVESVEARNTAERSFTALEDNSTEDSPAQKSLSTSANQKGETNPIKDYSKERIQPPPQPEDPTAENAHVLSKAQRVWATIGIVLLTLFALFGVLVIVVLFALGSSTIYGALIALPLMFLIFVGAKFLLLHAYKRTGDTNKTISKRVFNFKSLLYIGLISLVLAVLASFG